MFISKASEADVQCRWELSAPQIVIVKRAPSAAAPAPAARCQFAPSLLPPNVSLVNFLSHWMPFGAQVRASTNVWHVRILADFKGTSRIHHKCDTIISIPHVLKHAGPPRRMQPTSRLSQADYFLLAECNACICNPYGITPAPAPAPGRKMK